MAMFESMLYSLPESDIFSVWLLRAGNEGDCGGKNELRNGLGFGKWCLSKGRMVCQLLIERKGKVEQEL
jgi:hypothetical protein